MRFICFIFILLIASPCQAQLKEYAHIYDVDADEDIPMVWRLQEEYKKHLSNYDWHYDFSWNMPPVFDKDFNKEIQRFGSVEKRLNNPDEDSLLRDIKRLSPVYYPYIGPVLHTIPGLSGKILDLPGIKETKNKFPQKIASVFSDSPNIEFVSPELYIYLMPQIWGEDINTMEFPHIAKQRPNIPPVRIKKEFLKNVLKQVPTSDFAVNNETKPKSKGIRHYTATATTPLSPADVEAFVNTLDGLHEFDRTQNKMKFISLNGLFNYWDEKNGIDKNISFLKGVVNPCQTIVRKIKWSGQRQDFQKIIGTEAFGLDDWAYTCDKTLKAYRAISQDNAMVTALNILKKGYAYKLINQLNYYTPEERLIHKYFIEASIQLYSSTKNNMKAVTPYRRQLKQKLKNFDTNILGTPLILP